jgi:DNA-binding transcriptional MerR regulator
VIGFGAVTPGTLTINEAAETTGWSPRMLRYIESIGLVVPGRSASGYRLYGAAHLQRLRTLRELLDAHGIALGEIGFARRLRDEAALARAVDGWLDALPERPSEVAPDDWLEHEQRKHMRLLALAANPSTT